MYWAGLRAARESSEIWMSCVVDGGRIPEVGFFVIDDQEATPAQGEIPEENAVQFNILFGLSFPSLLKWVSGAAPPKIVGPPTYSVCLYLP